LELFLSLRVHQLAKELGIDSKSIVQKCTDEKLSPPEEAKGKPWSHMSPVSAGLAATIREWFAAGELKTAVETTQHVDAARIHKAPRKRTGKKGATGADGETGGQESATAVAEPPSAEEVLEAPPADETPVVILAEPPAPAETETRVELAAPTEAAQVAEAPAAPVAPPS
jgi:translation initiation factor IF-2